MKTSSTEQNNLSAVNIELTGIEKLDEYIRRIRSGEEITEISLSGLDINLELAETIGKALKNIPNLQILSLTHNNIDKGALAKIFDALKEHQTLQVLNLSNNNINFLNTAIIANFLKSNITLHTLDLSNNVIGSSGITLLSIVLGNNETLLRLDLADNKIIDQGYDHLCKVLKENKTLISLGICSHEGCNRIIERNREIKLSEEIKKLETSNNLRKEFAESDAKILPTDLLNISTLFDERVIEGYEAEKYLKEDESYEQYFGKKDSPKNKINNNDSANATLYTLLKESEEKAENKEQGVKLLKESAQKIEQDKDSVIRTIIKATSETSISAQASNIDASSFHNENKERTSVPSASPINRSTLVGSLKEKENQNNTEKQL